MTQPGNKYRSAPLRLRSRDRRLLLLVGDLLTAYIALGLALYAWSLRDQWKFTFFSERVKLWYYFVPLIWMLLLAELYDPHRASNRRNVQRGLSVAALTGLLFYAVIFFVYDGAIARVGILFFLIFVFLLTMIWRLLYIQIFTAPAFRNNALVVGAGHAGQTFMHAYLELKPPPFRILGYIDDDPAKQGMRLEGLPVLGGSGELLQLIRQENISDLIISITGKMNGDTFQTILDAQENGVEVTPMPVLYEELTRRVPIHHLESEWLVRSFISESRVGAFFDLAKRLVDILGGLVGLALSILILPWAALLTLLDTGSPVFYQQVRSGKDGKPYLMRKVRTMRQDAEKDGKAQLTQMKDERITRVGGFLRRTHIDELPQFWNVLRGEMSLVGPRSERPEWIAEFQKQIPFYRARLLVKPGITGWAQVNYSYYATVEEMAIKLEYDLYYIKHRTLWLDVLILLRTIGQVFGFRGR
jgi:exopolysaccharide biosynthesis polyprenyl glycosylphosphotransferase